MYFGKGFYLNWLLLIISIIIAILLWANKLDVQRPKLDDTVRDSSLILRAVNFILTAEIFFTISTFYGVCVWFIINRQKSKQKDTPILNFYTGGFTLLSTLKGLKSKLLSIKILSIVAASVMIASYVLDIYYIDSIVYQDVILCKVQNITIDIMPASQSSLSFKPASSASIFYAFGSKVAELPYTKENFTNSYIVPALGNVTGLQNYTTIQFDVSVDCQNPKLNMTAIKTDKEYSAQASNGSYLHLSRVSSLPQIIISPGSSRSNFTEIFISAGGFQDTPPIGVEEIPFGMNNVSTARCQTSVTYSLINDFYGWNHDADFTSAKDIAMLAQRASLDMFSTLGVVTTKTQHAPITEWLTNTVSHSENGIHYLVSNISMATYVEKLTMIAIDYLKGSGVNGSMTTMGNYCNVDAHVSHINMWYKVVFTLVQICILLFLISLRLVSTNSSTLLNDTPTLLRYISNNKE